MRTRLGSSGKGVFKKNVRRWKGLRAREATRPPCCEPSDPGLRLLQRLLPLMKQDRDQPILLLHLLLLPLLEGKTTMMVPSNCRLNATPSVVGVVAVAAAVAGDDATTRAGGEDGDGGAAAARATTKSCRRSTPTPHL